MTTLFYAVSDFGEVTLQDPTNSITQGAKEIFADAKPAPKMVEFSQSQERAQSFFNEMRRVFLVNGCCKLTMYDVRKILNKNMQAQTNYWTVLNKVHAVCQTHGVMLDHSKMGSDFCLKPVFHGYTLRSMHISIPFTGSTAWLVVAPLHTKGETQHFPFKNVDELVERFAEKLASSWEIAQCKKHNPLYTICVILDDLGIPNASACNTQSDLLAVLEKFKDSVPTEQDYKDASERFISMANPTAPTPPDKNHNNEIKNDSMSNPKITQ